MSSKSLQKRIAKALSEGVSNFDLFHQLAYMAATSEAGIGRDRVFRLARELQCPSAEYFAQVQELVETMRYNYADACRAIGEQVESQNTKYFLLRFSDSLSSGEPLAAYLAREAEVQGEHYENEYKRNLESLKMWNDGYVSVTISVALVVIINLVSTMIYDLGAKTIMVMVMVAAVAGFGVAWILNRAMPETKNGSLTQGSKEQRLALRLFTILTPVTVIVILSLALLKVDLGWILILASLLLAPIGMVSSIADSQTDKKEVEISAFLRSVGGTATSRGTTLKDALNHIKIESFPTLLPDIHRLRLRLAAFAKPELCWQLFATESGSKLVDQTIGMFFETVTLGGDPEQAGLASSVFAMKTSMMRARRKGVSATFSWLTIVMHVMLAALMIFLLNIIIEFVIMIETAMMSVGGEQGEEALRGMTTGVMAFSLPDVSFLEQITIGMIIVLVLINAFAIVGSQGSLFLKIFLYISIMMLVSGVSFLIVPSLVQLVWSV